MKFNVPLRSFHAKKVVNEFFIGFEELKSAKHAKIVAIFKGWIETQSSGYHSVFELYWDKGDEGYPYLGTMSIRGHIGRSSVEQSFLTTYGRMKEGKYPEDYKIYKSKFSFTVFNREDKLSQHHVVTAIM